MPNDKPMPDKPENPPEKEEMVVLSGGTLPEPRAIQNEGIPVSTQGSGVYETPQCYVTVDDKPCRYQPIHKCGACGRLICMEHTEEFRSPHTESRFTQFDGYYCPECQGKVIDAFNAEVEAYNQELKSAQNKQKAVQAAGCLGDTACSCVDDMCKSI